MTATARRSPRSRRLLRGRRLPRVGARTLAILAGVLLLGFGGWMWLRTSSLVAVRQIEITGVAGPDAGQIRSALRTAARRMTTLDVAPSAFHAAVARYPFVKHVSVSTSFPHGMTIAVSEQVPVAQVTAGGRTVTIGANGMLLHDPADLGPLPSLALSVAPGGERVTGQAAQEVALLAGAPYALLTRTSSVTDVPAQGLIAQLRSGPKIIFGSADQAAAKWSAAAGVLADRTSGGQLTAAGADYIDVTDPQRPAAGAGTDTAAGAAAPSSAASSSAATGSATTTGGAAGSTTALPGVPVTAAGASSPSPGTASGTAATVPTGGG